MKRFEIVDIGECIYCRQIDLNVKGGTAIKTNMELVINIILMLDNLTALITCILNGTHVSLIIRIICKKKEN